MLREAAGSRGFRMLVTPPEAHAEIGRSVAAALGGTWVSFDDAFFGEPGFNEGPAMWHLEGATLPLLNPLPVT